MKKTIFLTTTLLFSTPAVFATKTNEHEQKIYQIFDETCKDFTTEIEKGYGIGLYDNTLSEKDPLGQIAKETVVAIFTFGWKRAKGFAKLANNIYKSPLYLLFTPGDDQ